jgi:hypothetical protein
VSLIIDGITFDIPVVELTRTADFLDKAAERTEDGVLHRELIGVYYNYKLKLGATLDATEYAALWGKLTEPVEFHTVIVPAETGPYTFTAYFANVGDELRKDRGATTFWRSLTVNFIAKSPART